MELDLDKLDASELGSFAADLVLREYGQHCVGLFMESFSGKVLSDIDKNLPCLFTDMSRTQELTKKLKQ